VPRATRFNDSLDSRIPAIARRIRNRMRHLGLNEQALADECNRRACEALPVGAPLKMSRERIAKILMNCKKNPERSAAKVISHSELMVLSTALSASVEWLVGQHDNQDPVHWNVLAEPAHADHLLHLLAEHEEKAGELLVWAEFLMCSLVTPELMHAYHEAHFSELAALGLEEEKEKAVSLFDRIGNARRERLLSKKARSDYGYKQIIFYSDLRAIANGEREYCMLAAGLRRDSLRHLGRLVTDRSLRIELIVVNDDNTGHLKKALRDYDSLSVFGSNFTLWGYHSGGVAWSEHQSYIRPHRRLLDDLQAHAMAYEPRKVSSLLMELADDI
jgi:hypothetical protein